MAKLTLQQTLDKSLKTAKQYIDTELAKKADSHTHNYLPLTGGTLSGKLKINGPASDQPLQVRGIVGNSADGSSVDGLYLQYGANKEVYFGNSGGYTISADGSNYTGNAATATKLQTTRTLTVGNTGKTFDGSANVSWSLADIGAAAASHGHDFYVQGTSLSRTTNQDGNANDINQSGFYRPNNTASATNPFPDGMHSHILHGQHPSSTYAYQIGVPFVTHNKIYFRSHNSTSWSSWNKIYHSGDKPTPADIGASASGHTHSYLPLSGGTLTNANFGALTITRSGSANGASIKFANSNGDLGYIGMRGAANEGLIRWSADTTAMYPILDTSNFKTHVTPSAIGAIATTGGNVTGNLTLYNSSSGDSPGLVFQRGTTSDSYYDWKIHDSGGVLYFGVKTNSNSDFDKKISMSENGVITATTFSGTATNSNKVGGYSVWVGTQAQYNAISSKSSTTIYYITG